MTTEELIGAMIYDSDINNSRRPIEYKIEGTLGIGGFGRVLKVSRSKYDYREGKIITKLFALKTIPIRDILCDKNLKNRVITEIKLHRQLKHKYICKFEHSFDDDNNVNILLEYCPNTSLQNLLRIRKQPLTEFETRYYMFQVLQVLMYLKRQKIIHRDLTLSNIFLSENYTVKVGDFGLSFKETCEEERRGKVCGTQPYLAAEIIGNNVTYSYKTDIWAFGIDIFELLTGRLLFDSPEEAFEKLPNFSFERSVKISDEARNLLLKIFVKEQDRIDLNDIYYHPFFNQGINIGSDIEIPRYETIDDDIEKEKIDQIDKAFRDEINELTKKITITFTKENVSLKKKNLKDRNTKTMTIKFKSESPEAKNTVVINPFAEIINKNNNNKGSSMKGSNTKRNTTPFLSFKMFKNSSNNNMTNTNTSDKNNIDANSQERIRSKVNNTNEINEAFERINKKLDTISEIKPNLNIQTQCLNNTKTNSCNSDNEIINESRYSSMHNKMNILKNTNCSNDTLPDFLKQSLETIKRNNKNNTHSKSDLTFDEITIISYIDESRKYGIGYELNNGMYGVYFNDGAKMVSNKKELFYWTKEAKAEYNTYSLPLNAHNYLSASNSVSVEILRAKYQILNCFISEFNHLEERKLQMKANSSNSKNNADNSEHIIYLQRWKRASKGMLFLLSNKNVQISFYDKTKIVFLYEKKSVKYYDRLNISQEYNAETLYNVNCSDERINNKISYAIKEFLKGCQ